MQRQAANAAPAFSTFFSPIFLRAAFYALSSLPSHLLSLISGTLIYGELKRLSITVTVLPSYHFMKIDR